MKPHIDIRTTKATVRIENDLYRAVKKHFYHGQLQMFLTQIFISLNKMIQDEKLMDIIAYTQGKGTLVLKPNKED